MEWKRIVKKLWSAEVRIYGRGWECNNKKAILMETAEKFGRNGERNGVKMGRNWKTIYEEIGKKLFSERYFFNNCFSSSYIRPIL